MCSARPAPAASPSTPTDSRIELSYDVAASDAFAPLEAAPQSLQRRLRGVDPAGLVVKSILNGEQRQNYPVADMIFSPARLVSLISQDMTLMPGDVIACGTSLGIGSIKDGASVEITIDGIGSLVNTLQPCPGSTLI